MNKKFFLGLLLLILVLALVGCVSFAEQDKEADAVGTVFVVDSSRNMSNNNISELKDALKVFTEEGNIFKDKIGLLEFEEEVETLYEFEYIEAKLSEKIDQLSSGNDESAFWDGIYEAVEIAVENDGEGMSMGVIVFTASEESGVSEYQGSEVIELAKDNEIPIYTVGLGITDGRVLEEISKETGGLAKCESEEESLEKIALELYRSLKFEQSDVFEPYM